MQELKAYCDDIQHSMSAELRIRANIDAVDFASCHNLRLHLNGAAVFLVQLDTPYLGNRASESGKQSSQSDSRVGGKEFHVARQTILQTRASCEIINVSQLKYNFIC